MKKYNVLIVDDQPIYRKGIMQILLSNQAVEEIHEASSLDKARQIMDKGQVDILFVHYESGSKAFEIVKQFLSQYQNCKIIITSNVDSVPVIVNFFKIGVKGFLHKTMDVQHVLNAMRSVSLGDYYCYSGHDEEINSWLKVGFEGRLPAIRLSEREKQVVAEIARGKTSKDIAEVLKLDIRTIETYRYELLQKFSVRNTAQMLTYMYVNAIIN